MAAAFLRSASGVRACRALLHQPASQEGRNCCFARSAPSSLIRHQPPRRSAAAPPLLLLRSSAARPASGAGRAATTLHATMRLMSAWLPPAGAPACSQVRPREREQNMRWRQEPCKQGTETARPARLLSPLRSYRPPPPGDAMMPRPALRLAPAAPHGGLRRCRAMREGGTAVS